MRENTAARRADGRMKMAAPTARSNSSPRGDANPFGSIEMFVGCMFSGKTSALLRRLESVADASAVTIKHVIDDRYGGDAVVTHNGRARAARSVFRAKDIPPLIPSDLKAVGIDEAHFFDDAIVAIVEGLARRGVDVVLTALDRDRGGRPFAVVERLRRCASSTLEMHAACARCGARATRTQRLTPIVDGRMVGGAESYEPRCAGCWRPPPENAPSARA